MQLRSQTVDMPKSSSSFPTDRDIPACHDAPYLMIRSPVPDPEIRQGRAKFRMSAHAICQFLGYNPCVTQGTRMHGVDGTLAPSERGACRARRAWLALCASCAWGA
jgi:hypothetical protein